MSAMKNFIHGIACMVAEDLSRPERAIDRFDFVVDRDLDLEQDYASITESDVELLALESLCEEGESCASVLWYFKYQPEEYLRKLAEKHLGASGVNLFFDWCHKAYAEFE